MKRGISSLVSGLLVLAMVFSFIPAQLFADEGEEVVGLTVRAYPEEAIGDVYRVEGRDVYVSCITPCKLGYYNGEKYVCLKCLKEGPSTYRFYVPAGTDDVALVIFGDTDLNGRITQADATKVKAYLKGNTTLDAVQRLAGDVNSDNRMTNADAIKIKAYLKGTVDFDWDLGTVTECTVEHYKQTGAGSEEYVKDESLTDELRFVAGITVTAEEKAVAGYVFDVDNENNIKAGLTAEGQRLVLKLYYKVDADGDGTPDDEQMYTVRFFDCDLTDGGLLSEKQYRWGTEVEDLEVPEPRHEGYTFMGWQPELERVTRDADYTAVFTPNGETPYKVEYYKQTEAGSSEFLRDDYLTEFLSGVTDSPVEKEPPVLIGYAFDEDNIDNKLSGMIHPDGSLVLKLYYKIDADNDGTPDDEQKYVVTFVDWDGTFLSSDQYLWGTPAEDLEVPEVSRQGYTFIGWEPELARVTGKATYKADYIANDNTPFRVEYYKQTQAGRDEYLKDDLLTEYRVGTTDTVVTATPPELLLYAFDEDNENNVLRGTVYGDGSLVLKLYYKVDSDGNGIPDDEEMFTITFVDEDGETVLSREQYLRGTQPEDIVQPAAVKEGYTFAGWDPELAEVTADATYRATYTPNGDTPYVVEYFVQAMAGSEVYYKSENLTERYTGTTGDTVSAEPKAVTNFVFDEDNENNVISGVIAADSSLALKLYYKVDADGDGLADDEEAILTFVDEDGTTVIEKKNYLIGTPASEVEAPSPVKEGYTFAGWDPEIADVTADATYRATYRANTDTPYSVEYYMQTEAGGSAFVKEDTLTERLTGTTDSRVSAEPKAVEGFAYDEDNENNISSGTVAADGSLVLKLYYKIDRDNDGNPDDEQKYTVRFFDCDLTDGGLLSEKQYLWGTAAADIEQPSVSHEGYSFRGWTPELATVTADADYTAVFAANTDTPYKVEYYKQTEAGGREFVKDDYLTEYLAGTTDTLVEKVPPVLIGYAFDEDNTGNKLSGMIHPDGSLVLKIYYKIDSDNDGTPDDEQTYTLRFFDCNLTDGGLLGERQYVWGTMPEDIETPEVRHQGYTFAGWTPAIAMVTADADYTAVFTANTNTPYKVEYYKQTEIGREEFLKDDLLTEFLTGTTDTAVEKVPPVLLGYAYDRDNLNNKPSGMIHPDGSLVLKLYYKIDADNDGTPDDEQTYTLRFFDCDLTDGGFLGERQYVWGTMPEDIQAPEVRHQGYTFAGWTPALAVVTADADYTAVFTANTDTPYKVEYYKQTEVGREEFIKDDLLTEFLTGTTDTAVEKVPPVLLGYVYDRDNVNNKPSGMVHPDGSLVLKLYYKIDSDGDGTADDEQVYTVTFLDEDGVSVLSTGRYFYGTRAEDIVEHVFGDGYLFTGWDHEFEDVYSDQAYIANYSRVLEFVHDNNNQYGVKAGPDINNVTEVIIPSENGGRTITNVLSEGFNTCTLLESVTFEEGITTIGIRAFRGCTALDSIIFPDTITNIEAWAFYNCQSLESVVVPNNVTALSARVFGYCTTLQSAYLPAGMSSIGDSAFFECTSLESVNLPDGLTAIGSSAFSHCYSIDDISIPQSVSSIGDGAFYSCNSLTSQIVIPEGITRIGDETFYNCSKMSGIVIPESVTEIGGEAFFNCKSLTELTLPAGLVSVGRKAFMSCSGVSEVTIPDGVQYIWTSAFYRCGGLTENDIPSSVLTPHFIAVIAQSSITEVEISGEVEIIDDNAFNSCSNLESVIIRDGVTSIGNHAFYDCSKLTSVSIADSVSELGEQAFWRCSSLADIVVPEGVTVIPTSCFGYCRQLQSVTLPGNINKIDNSAFSHCDILESIIYRSTVSNWNNIEKYSNWNSSTGDYTVYCTDGTISKDGTITYY